MHYPNRIQAALVFEERFETLEAAARDFCRIIELKTGDVFTAPDGMNDELIRLVSATGGLAARFERVGGPPPLEPFEGALASPVTGLFAPTAREALIGARSHVLVEVSHGAASDGRDEAPSSPAQPVTLARFTERLETLALMVRITTDHGQPSLVHWTQSDQVLTPEQFEAYAIAGLPGPLHIHPHLFGSAHDAAREPLVGVRSFGAAHWLGREVVVPPSALPWQAAYQAILAFVHFSTGEAGTLIPDGDTFGSEDGGECFRVHHREADPAAGVEPAFEITPLRHDVSGFVCEDYAASAQIVKLRGGEQADSSYEPDAAPSAAAALREARRMIGEIGPEPAHPETSAPDTSGPAPSSPSGPGLTDPTDSRPAAPKPAAQATLGASTKRSPRAMIRPTPSQAGEETLSGRSLRARVFGRSED